MNTNATGREFDTTRGCVDTVRISEMLPAGEGCHDLE